MKTKDKIYIFLFCSVIVCLYLIMGSYKHMNDDIYKVYNVYLDDTLIGVIEDKNELYNLIDKEQQSIKDRYNVKNVYPPKGLQVIENYSYKPASSSLNTVYKKIAEMEDFTISGFEVKIGASENHEEYSFNILDKNVLNSAIETFILAFIDEEGYKDYMEGNNEELEDIGVSYKDMGIIEDISIKGKYISVNDKIYENSSELAQNLLFGFDYKENRYKVKEGDTIESVSEDHTLNTQEFLIANPKYTSKDSLLTLGEEVNITLINPQISFKYTVNEMKEVERQFEKTVVRDNTKPSSFSEITQAGVTGLSIQIAHYNVVNGEPDSETVIDEERIIREKVDEITTKGRQESVWGWESSVDTGSGWRWPTENPYAITSEFAPRWGKYHNGIDISGSGFGSKIYAASDGIVTNVVSECADIGVYGSSCGSGYGNYVVIHHGSNVYTLYAHMTNRVPVSVGQSVSRGTVVGYMGNSGSSKGTHLHFGYSVGNPMQNGVVFSNPRKLYR